MFNFPNVSVFLCRIFKSQIAIILIAIKATKTPAIGRFTSILNDLERLNVKKDAAASFLLKPKLFTAITYVQERAWQRFSLPSQLLF